MSWITDGIANKYKAYGELGSKFAGSIGLNDYSNFVRSELVDKAELRGAQIEGFASGLPIVGGLVKGVNNVEQMEDLFNNTGKVSAYPGVQSSGLSSAGKSVAGISRKIEAGTHDLFEHYTGTKDDTIDGLHKKGILKFGDEI